MKKGQFSFTKGLVIMITVMLLSTVLIANVLKKTDEVIEESECYKSIQAHKQILQITDGSYAPDIICPTLYKDVDKSYKEYDIKKLLANDMVNAWGLWNGSTFFVGEEEVFCHVYKVYSFEEKGMVIDDFKQFLFDEEIGNTGVFYSDYITPRMSEELAGIEEQVEAQEQTELEPFIINTDNDYAIIFKHVKGKPKVKIFGQEIVQKEDVKQNGMVLGIGGGAILGGIIGAQTGAIGLAGFCTATLVGAAVSPVCAIIGGAGGALAGGVVGGLVYYFTIDPNDPQNYASFVMIVPYTPESLILSDCTKLPVSQAEKTS
ncbi:MAG: hypothetical protein ABH828_02755 [archaeon]